MLSHERNIPMIIIDRIEEDRAVCEFSGKDGEGQILIDLSELPAGVKEGEVLVRTEKGYSVDREATETRRKKIVGLQDSLWE